MTWAEMLTLMRGLISPDALTMREMSRRVASSTYTRVPRWRPPARMERNTTAASTTATPVMMRIRFFTARRQPSD